MAVYRYTMCASTHNATRIMPELEQRRCKFGRNAIIFRFLLAVLSSIVALALCEVVLRYVRPDPSSLDRGLTWDPELNAKHYARAFLYRHRNDVRLVSRNHDGRLGWDHDPAGDRIRVVPDINPRFAEHSAVQRILAIGDSFTFGAEVDGHETYPHQLQKILKKGRPTQCVNMGVPGYGIDQAVLKYTYWGRHLNPDVVIFGIHTGN